MIGIAKGLALRALTSDAALSHARSRLPPVHAIVLMYHEVAADDVDVEAWTVVRRSQLERQLDYVDKIYDIVSISEALNRFGSPHGRPMAVITFDDGHSGNFDTLLPIVQARRIPVTVFVASGHIETQHAFWFDRLVNALQTTEPVELDLRRFGALGRYAVNTSRGRQNWSEMQRLLDDLKALSPERCEIIADELAAELQRYGRRGGWRLRPMTRSDVVALSRSPFVEIGGHTHCHRLQTQLPEKECRESLERNRQLLAEWTGRSIEHFAYPSGAHNREVAAMVRACGYRTAMTTMPDIWRAGADPHRIPRVGVGRYDSPATFRASLLGGVRPLAALLAPRLIAART